MLAIEVPSGAFVASWNSRNYIKDCRVQGSRSSFQSRGVWSLNVKISSGKNSETCYFMKKVGEAVFPSAPGFDTSERQFGAVGLHRKYLVGQIPYIRANDVLTANVTQSSTYIQHAFYLL